MEYSEDLKQLLQFVPNSNSGERDLFLHRIGFVFDYANHLIDCAQDGAELKPEEAQIIENLALGSMMVFRGERLLFETAESFNTQVLQTLKEF